MKFKTDISKSEGGQHKIRGYDVIDLMRDHTFTDVLFLLWRGDLPKENEVKLLESVMVASMEHGVSSPSAFVPRVSASVGNPMHVALATGALSIGERHGGAAESCAVLLASDKEAADIVAENKIIAGFGHKIYKEEDPRAALLYSKAKELGFTCEYFNKAYDIERELLDKKGKKLPLNIDGAMAACMLEMGFDPRLGKAMFIIPRLIGSASHVLEEYEQSNSYHRLEEDDIE